MKKKTLVPLITFLLGICLVSLIVYKTDTHEKEQRHITAQLNVATYGERIKNEITNGIEITDTLKQILISENGEIHQFETIAGNLMSDSIESVQLAPNGVVTDIYPANGNEAGKIDLIHDKDRGKISCYARDNHTIITQGPFKLKQGEYGIAVRNPIYLKDKNGHEYFWGFTIVILRVPDIFSDSISALSDFGYDYKISKTDAPWSDTYKVVYQSDGQINHPVSYTFTIGDENWKFEVTPKSGWRNATLLIIIIGMFLTISLLLSVLTRVWLVAKEHKKTSGFLSVSMHPKYHSLTASPYQPGGPLSDCHGCSPPLSDSSPQKQLLLPRGLKLRSRSPRFPQKDPEISPRKDHSEAY